MASLGFIGCRVYKKGQKQLSAYSLEAEPFRKKRSQTLRNKGGAKGAFSKKTNVTLFRDRIPEGTPKHP